MTPQAGLSIREVADITGVTSATLRMWETRYGFPSPDRLASGHRRYSSQEVERVVQVLRDRDSGMSLQAAIERRRSSAPRPERSVYAGMRRRRPDLHPYLLPKRTLIGLSHAIEDECYVRGERPLLFGSFQREQHYREAERRWRDIARTAELVVAFADFDERRDPPGGPIELPIRSDQPLSREWALVCEGRDYSACLTAWERPGQDGIADSERIFETIWTVDADVVRDAMRIVLDLAASSAPDVVERVAARLRGTPPPTGDPVGLVAALSSRMVAYVGGANSLPAPHRSSR